MLKWCELVWYFGGGCLIIYLKVNDLRTRALNTIHGFGSGIYGGVPLGCC